MKVFFRLKILSKQMKIYSLKLLIEKFLIVILKIQISKIIQKGKKLRREPTNITRSNNNVNKKKLSEEEKIYEIENKDSNINQDKNFNHFKEIGKEFLIEEISLQNKEQIENPNLFITLLSQIIHNQNYIINEINKINQQINTNYKELDSHIRNIENYFTISNIKENIEINEDINSN